MMMSTKACFVALLFLAACVMTVHAKRWIPVPPTTKPGRCPLYPCQPPPNPLQCVDTCQSDLECLDDRKCCYACGGCKTCTKPWCGGYQTCSAGQECRHATIWCVTTPCHQEQCVTP
ncbi:hypothetical protein V1264_016040 [Littorina saxatilis]|uniref:WAP domain-containing protein n=1 Tax=Littorina saxatilis TaxID=31220 RepID=A0AAN9BMD3_9CAEN